MCVWGLDEELGMSADMREVFRRLGEKKTRLIDERFVPLQYYPSWKFKEPYLLFHEGPVGLHHVLEGGE